MGALTVVQLVPRLDTGGAERSTVEIASALVAAGHRAVVISAGGRWVEAVERAGATHVTLDLGRKSLFTLLRVFTLRRLLRELRPDIVHARSRLPAWIAWHALRGLRPRPHWVTTVHGLNSPGRYSAILTSGERVICVSNAVRDYVRAHYPNVDPARLVVIPRGIDREVFARGLRPSDEWLARFASERPSLHGRPLVLLPGRGTRLKGHADAIVALARLRERHGLEAGLWLLGAREPGRERYVEELERLAADRGVAVRVVIDAARADVREAYARADVVLQVSAKPESFGRTVVEALAIGTPVVGYAHGGVGELLRELFPDGATATGDVDALADTLARVLRERPAVAPFDSYRLDAMQAATLAVYDALGAAR